MSNPFLVAAQRGENFSAVSTDALTFSTKLLPERNTYSAISSGSSNYMVMTAQPAYPKSTNAYTNTSNTWTVGTLPKTQEQAFVAVSPSGKLATMYADGTQDLVTTQVQNMPPVVGVDITGRQTNAILGPDLKLKTAGYVENFQPSATDEFTNIKVQQVYKHGSGVFATGTATTNQGTTYNLAWYKSTGVYEVYKKTVTPATNISLGFASSKNLIATGSNVNYMDLSSLTPNGPVRGFNPSAPNYPASSNVSISGTSLWSNGTNTIVSGPSAAGLWKSSSITENGIWARTSEQLTYVKCKTYTSYTFPGETDNGLVAQIITGNTTGDTPPSKWSTQPNFTANISTVEKYHGLTNSPSVTVTWVRNA